MSPELIQTKLRYIKYQISDLKICLEKLNEQSLNDRFLLLAGERLAEEIIESAISINQMILKEKFQKLADNYYHSFVDLNCLNVFSETDLESLAKTAGFRNRLAHDYLNLDKKITIKSLENILKIYPKYLKKINEYLEK